MPTAISVLGSKYPLKKFLFLLLLACIYLHLVFLHSPSDISEFTFTLTWILKVLLLLFPVVVMMC